LDFQGGGKPKGSTKKRPWSEEERDAVRDGVATHGYGEWVTILDAYQNVFDERTNVMVKDCWRTMVKNGSTLWTKEVRKAVKCGVDRYGKGKWARIRADEKILGEFSDDDLEACWKYLQKLK
jgi:hypothetical protein